MAAQLVAYRVVLSSTELVSGGRSIGILRLRTKGHGVLFSNRQIIIIYFLGITGKESMEIYFHL
jgi:hypothetical protein